MQLMRRRTCGRLCLYYSNVHSCVRVECGMWCVEWTTTSACTYWHRFAVATPAELSTEQRPVHDHVSPTRFRSDDAHAHHCSYHASQAEYISLASTTDGLDDGVRSSCDYVFERMFFKAPRDIGTSLDGEIVLPPGACASVHR